MAFRASFRMLVFFLVVVVVSALLLHRTLSSLGHSESANAAVAAIAAAGGSGAGSGSGGSGGGSDGKGGAPPAGIISIAEEDVEAARKTLGLVQFDRLSGPELKSRIEELLRIKQSVLQELRGLEAKRKEMQMQLSGFHQEIEALKTEATRRQAELERLRVSSEQARLAQEEYARRNTPEIRAPLSLRATDSADRRPMDPPSEAGAARCTMDSCFDFSRCSLTSGAPVYLYDRAANGELFGGEVEFTDRAEEACLFMVLASRKMDSESLSAHLGSLPHFNGDGRNHLLVVVADDARVRSTLPNRVMVAQAHVPKDVFRPAFDLVLPSAARGVNSTKPEVEAWQLAAAILPVRRRYLISFQGAKWKQQQQQQQQRLSEAEEAVVSSLRDIKRDVTDDDAYVDVNCKVDAAAGQMVEGDWLPCGTEETRGKVLSSSTFSLIVSSPVTRAISTASLQLRLHEALRWGAIPVVLGSDSLALPFSEFVDWRKAAVMVPTARATELHFLLRSFSDADLFDMQRQGAYVWRTYLSRTSLVLKTVVQTLRERLLIPPPVAKDSPSPDAFDGTKPTFTDQLTLDLEPSEPLGPLEPPRPSPVFRRNFSSLSLDGYLRWNGQFDPFVLLPNAPWDPLLPTDAKFLGSPGGFRPIGDGAGGTGREFSQAIGGNLPSEQFTVVMLTYEREQVLLDSLSRLYGLPFLNKVTSSVFTLTIVKFFTNVPHSSKIMSQLFFLIFWLKRQNLAGVYKK